MIKLIKTGKYQLIETKGQTKIINFDNKKPSYAWVYVEDIGEILITSHKKHQIDHTLAVGSYRLYDVTNEEELTDTRHLELSTGESAWQGYLLITGLPTNKDIRARIIPTTQLITNKYSGF